MPYFDREGRAELDTLFGQVNDLTIRRAVSFGDNSVSPHVDSVQLPLR
jgi:hypothetical protein